MNSIYEVKGARTLGLMAHDVFISHSTKDKQTADAVCAVLESKSIRCWVAPRDIQPGADWGESIIEAIRGARVMVLVFSQNANDSVQIKREVERAIHHGVIIIPLRIQDILPSGALEYSISTSHWLDAFVPPMERHLTYLADTVRANLDGLFRQHHPGGAIISSWPSADSWVFFLSISSFAGCFPLL
jgi:TIR domain